MNDFFETPTAEDAPKGSASYPWTKFVEYKSGKTPQGFANAATPDQVNAGFSYYDKEKAETVHISKMAASIIAVLSGVQGTVPDGTRYLNYYSNLVQDTRTQMIDVRLGYGENSVVIASGIYNEFKVTLPQGVGYSKYAILYLHDTQDCVAVRLTAGLETALQEAIAAETKQKPNRVNLFDIFQITGRFWAFRFSGVFAKRTKDGEEWAGHGDMFFYPELKAGIVTADNFPDLLTLQAAVESYVEGWQLDKQSKKKSTPAAKQDTPQQLQESSYRLPYSSMMPKSSDPFPTLADEPAPGVLEGEGDDLPF